MNKKSLLKKMSIVVASAAMMVTALPLTASAASFVEGDYTASVNFYVPRAQAPQNLYNAYLNDTSIPPKNAATNNVTVNISDDELTFDLAINNAQLGIETLAKLKGADITLSGAQATGCTTHPGTRYTKLHAEIDLSDVSAKNKLEYVFGTSDFHAKITKKLIGNLSITPYDNTFTANPVLEIELPSGAIK